MLWFIVLIIITDWELTNCHTFQVIIYWLIYSWILSFNYCMSGIMYSYSLTQINISVFNMLGHSRRTDLGFFFFIFAFFSFILISWRLITLQCCSGFCHTLTWIIHGFTCVPHPDPPSHLPPHPIPLGLPSAPALSTCLMHPTWAGDLFHPWQYTCFNAILSEHPTITFSQSPKVSCSSIPEKEMAQSKYGPKN